MTEEIKILLTKYLTGNINPEETSILETWISSSEENKNLFHDIRSVWLLSGTESKGSHSSYKKVWTRIEHKILEYEKESRNTSVIKFKSATNFKRILAYAAMLVLAICTGAFIMYLVNVNGLVFEPVAKNNSRIMNDTVEIIAQKGSRSEIILPDGSKVWLNSNSKIKYYPGFADGKREVHLIGEAYFDIKQTEDKRLFYVHTSDIHVKVLGTKFNVKSYPEEGTIETTLEKGKVDIEKTVQDQTIKLLSLEPNQQATFIKKEGRIYLEKVKDEIEKNNAPTTPIKRKEQIILDEKVDVGLYTSWKDGRLPFKSESFENMAIQFERWFDVKINIENQDLKDIVFTATFDKHSIERALEVLQMTHPFEYEYNIEKNIVTIK